MLNMIHSIAVNNEKLRVAIDRIKKDATIGAYTALSNILTPEFASDLAPLRIGVVRNITVEPLIPIIRGEFSRFGFLADVFVGDFDTIAAETLNPVSALYAHNPEIILIINWLETLSTALTTGFITLSPDDTQKEIDRVILQLQVWVTGVRKNSSAPVIINNYPIVDLPTLGIIDSQSETGHTAIIHQLNRELLKVLKTIPDVYIIDYYSVIYRIGLNHAVDYRYWQIARSPLKRDALIALGVEYGKYLRALRGKSRKCIVLDCDNTLWGGVLGEDGIDGIKIGSTYPGNGFVSFQKEILNLYHRGVLLTLCSKNNEEDVFEALEKHPEMILKKHHFASWQINWEDKASNIMRISKTLNIGLDSMVFVDDSEFECSLIEEQLPEVLTVNLQGDSSLYKNQILEKGYFDSLVFTEEDKKRTEMYHGVIRQEELKLSSASYEEYLNNLGLVAEIGVPDSTLVPRVSQLTQKTNQFNLTTLRYSVGDIQRMIGDSQSYVYYLKLKDRFTDLGLIGVAIVKLQEQGCQIDTFAISCRALGRGAEDALLGFILEQAKLSGCNKVYGSYLPTKKNMQVSDFYQRKGFKEIPSNTAGSQWVWNYSDDNIFTPPSHIQLLINS